MNSFIDRSQKVQWVMQWPSDLVVIAQFFPEAEMFLTIKEVPLHTAFYYHPPIVLTWLKSGRNGRKFENPA